MTNKERFMGIYRDCITREGADTLLNYLENKSDFFTAPASTRYHNSCAGGLLDHHLNVYDILRDYLARPYVREKYGMNYSDETIAIVSLLHDICKVNYYKVSFRNKKIDGKWEEVPYYEIEDNLPYGHGEKSVYILSGFLRLTREEAFAIRYHMGFTGTEETRLVSSAFEKFPLALALSVADMEAAFILEPRQGK